MDAVAQDDPGAEEPDAGHDVGGDPGGVDAAGAGEQDGEQLEQRGAEGDQGVGAQPGGTLPPLPFQPDRRPQGQGDRGRAAKYPTLTAGIQDRNPAMTIPSLLVRSSF